jgi:hypothetical protein
MICEDCAAPIEPVADDTAPLCAECEAWYVRKIEEAMSNDEWVDLADLMPKRRWFPLTRWCRP